MIKNDLFFPIDAINEEGKWKIGKLDTEFSFDIFPDTREKRLDHLYYLYKYASLLDDSALILEIGTGNAYSTIAMAMGIRDTNKKIITVDPKFINNYSIFYDTKQFIQRADVDQYINIVSDTSESFFNHYNKQQIDMIHIDGDHSYEAVKIDCRWLDLVKHDGIAVFDDWVEDVKRAVLEYFAEHQDWELLTDSTKQFRNNYWKTVFWRN
jgi:predicted O-methyltransferase YrrM